MTEDFSVLSKIQPQIGNVATVTKKTFLFEPAIDLIITGLTQDITKRLCEKLEFKDEQDFMKNPSKVKELLEALQKESKMYEDINLSTIEIEPKLAGSFGNTFFTMNRIIPKSIGVILPFKLELKEGQPYSAEIYEQMTTELGKEHLYIEESLVDNSNSFIKIICFSDTKKMLSSGMDKLTITSDDLKTKLKEYNEVYIEGFLLANNFDKFCSALKEINSKINITLSSKYIFNEEQRKQLRDLIEKGKIKEIYGNDEEIEALFESLFESLSEFKENRDTFLINYSKINEITILETKGKDGAVLYHKGEKIEVPALYLQSKELESGNVMGAGDTFLAGFLKAREILGEDNRENLEIALKFGIILATEVLKIREGSLSRKQIKNMFKGEIGSEILKQIVKEMYEEKDKFKDGAIIHPTISCSRE